MEELHNTKTNNEPQIVDHDTHSTSYHYNANIEIPDYSIPGNDDYPGNDFQDINYAYPSPDETKDDNLLCETRLTNIFR